MNEKWLDLQHRGFEAYRKETADKANAPSVYAQTGKEQVDTVLTDCDIQLDWIQHIELALPLIENAVRESRQFILRQGETVPIEKVRRVSRPSVEHLSRHSEMITKQPRPGEDLIPDKLHITENVGTYTVYENRFLYMLLCYLRDFTGLRYKKIMQNQSAFSSDVTITREMQDGDRTIRYELHYTERSHGLAGAMRQENQLAIRRISAILQTVDLLLRTDLMKEVSTAPMLKPPITRTNVLLHDPNFRAAFELYSFLTGYDGDGFRQVERHRQSGAFTDAMREDYAALQSLTAYLSYRHGGMGEELHQRFLAEEQRREAEAEQQRKAVLAALKRKVGNLDGPAQTYLLALEGRNHQLETKMDALLSQQTLWAQTRDALEAAQAENAKLLGQLRQKDALLSQSEERIRQLERNNDSLAQEAQRQRQEYDSLQKATQQQHEAALEQQKQEFLAEYAALAEKLDLANGRLRARSIATGEEDPGEVFDTREAFAQLEAEFKAFERFYKAQWKLAKKRLRKQIWKKNAE